MSLSLRDQLLQAGLINEKQAQQAANPKHHQRKTRAEKKPEVVDEKTLALRKAEAEKREKDLAANRALIEKVEQKAKRAEIRQLVDQHKLPKLDSDDFYNFVSGKKVKRMPVDAARRAQLVSGALVIVNCDGNYEIVPGKIAERIRQRDPNIVLTHRAPSPSAAPAATEAEDPYKDFVVPDDLLW